MDTYQFAAFIAAFQDGMVNLQIGQAPATASTSKISVKISIFKGAPKDNVMTWILQVQNLFKAQGIKNDQTRIYYTATGFEEASLH